MKQFSGFLTEDHKTEGRFDVLVRAGLAEKKHLTSLHVILGKMSAGENLSRTERNLVTILFNKMLDLITNNDSIFQKVKQSVKEDFLDENAYSGSSIHNPNLLNTCNRYLAANLDHDLILAPEIGFEKIRKVLASYAIDVPAMLNLNQNEGEEVFEVEQFGPKLGTNYGNDGVDSTANPTLYLYVYYFLNDQGVYEFFAKIVDEKGLTEYLQDEG